ncbi:MAG: 50S ribosomal protein L10 [Candidatus Babeliales bacterium]
MNREEKAQVVQNLRNSYTADGGMMIINYRGLTVAQMQELRKELKKQKSSLKVAKARLIKLAFADVQDIEKLSEGFKNQIGVVFAPDDSSAVAKVLFDFAKKHATFDVVSGVCESRFFDKKGIERLGTLPSRDVLYAQLCTTLQSPLYRLIMVGKMQLINLLSVISEIQKKKSGE